MTEKTLDKIVVRELELLTRIGYTAQERATPQRIVIDIEVGTDTTAAAMTKDVADSVCYYELTQLCQEILGSAEWVLLEEVAHQLTGAIFRHFNTAQSVMLEIRKFIVPAVKWVGVQTTRSRAQFNQSSE